MKKFPIFILLFILITLAVYATVKVQKRSIHEPASEGMQTENQPTEEAITFTNHHIVEENFSGDVVTVTGASMLAKTAQAYIDSVVSDFRTKANNEVPGMREEFGAESPSATYTITIKASEVDGPQTQSIVLDEYIYVGGANGMSIYKVFTASKQTGAIIPLADLIQSGKEDAFLAFVKAQLLASSQAGDFFKEDVNALTFANLDNYSIDAKNFTVYFSKYAIGPGALGEIAFPIPLTQAKQFLRN